MAQKILVSKAGFNVLTTGNTNLTFSSDLATHSIYAVVNFTMDNALTEENYTHGLSYAPKCWVFLDGGTFLNRIPVVSGVGAGWDYYITSSVIHLKRATAGNRNFILIIFTRTFVP